MTSKHGLAVLFASVIAAVVAYSATYSRWQDTRPGSTETNLLSAAEQNTLPPASASSVLPTIAAAAALKWAHLNANQHLALAPFARDWDSFSDSRKQKWLKIAEQYPLLPPDAQERLHQRMTEWVHMSPEQRRLARENFQLSKAVPPQQRKKAWAAYQQLPEDQKKKLEAAERKNRRPTIVSTPLTGKNEVKDLSKVRRLGEPAKPGNATGGAAAAPASSPSLPAPPRPTAASAAEPRGGGATPASAAPHSALDTEHP